MIGAEHQEEEILGKAYDSRLMLRVLRYLRPYWKLLAVSFVFLMLQTGAQLLGPYITKIAIDRYIAQKDIAGLDLMALAYLGDRKSTRLNSSHSSPSRMPSSA